MTDTTPPPEPEYLTFEWSDGASTVRGAIPRPLFDYIVYLGRDLGWMLDGPASDGRMDPTVTRVMVELDGDAGGRTWSAGMPDGFGLPREFQGLQAVHRDDPGAALRGLADLLDETARGQLGLQLAALQAVPAPVAEAVSIFDGGDLAAVDDPAGEMLGGR